MEPLMNGHRVGGGGCGRGQGPGRGEGGAPVVTRASVKAAAITADTNNHKAKTTTNPSFNGNERGILTEAKGQNGAASQEAIPIIVNENEKSCNNGVGGPEQSLERASLLKKTTTNGKLNKKPGKKTFACLCTADLNQEGSISS